MATTSMNAEDWAAVVRLMQGLDVRSLVEEQDTRVVTATESVTGALAQFMTHGIRSAPVFDPAQGGFIGMIDTLDLVAFLCRFSGSLSGTKRLEQEELNFDKLKSGLEALDDEQRTKIRNTPVQALIGLSERTAWSPASVATPPHTLVKLLSDQNTHRIPITGEEGDQFLGLVTQWDIIKWLNTTKTKLPQAMLSLRVRDFRQAASGKRDMISVPSHATMIEALIKMDQSKVSALPVVDMQGSLKGNISAIDISRLGLTPTDQPEDMLKKLFVPVAHFVTQQPITCTMDDTIENILEAVSTNRVHRLWVVDSNSKPVGVVSLCDVLAQLVPPSETYLS